MKTTHRATLGLILIAAGIVVAIIGWWGVSGETEVAFQLPFLASAGVGAVLLFGGGAILLVTTQLESDATRMDGIEDAIRQLAGEIGRLADELEPRGRGRLRAVGERSGRGAKA